MSDSILVKGGCVLTLGARTQNHAEADVLIEDGIVTEVGASIRARVDEQIDASHAIVMPGFVDTHRRCWPALLKNAGGTEGQAGAVVPSPDDVYAGTLVSLLGALEAGVTSVVDWFEGPGTGDHLDAALAAHADAGLRGALVVVPEAGTDPAAAWRSAVERRSGDLPPHVSLAAGAHLSGDPDTTAASWAAARTLGLRIHVIAGTAERGLLAELGGRGLLGPDVTVAHTTGVSDEDLDAIASGSCGVALTPASDMTIGPGAPPMQAILDRGIRPGLGVDAEWTAPGDILAQMRAAISIQHATYFDLKLAGKGGLPNLLSTRDVIRYGTIDGARAAGIDAAAGSIEVGKPADLIVLRTDRPNIHPINDPIGAVVWGVDTSNLDWVLVEGTPLMRDGALVADAARARSLADDAVARLGPSAAREGAGSRQ